MKQFFRKLGVFVENKRLFVIMVSLVLIVPAIFGAMQIDMVTGTETFVSTDTQVYKDLDRFNQHFSTSVVAVLLPMNDMIQLLQPANVKAMEFLENEMDANPKIMSAIGPVFYLKQAVLQQSGSQVLPEDPATLQAMIVDPQSGQIRPDFRNVFPDGEHAIILVVIEGGLSWDDEKVAIDDAREAVARAGFIGIEPIVTGEPVFRSELANMMPDSMRSMLIVSVIIMLLVLTVMFSVRGFFAWRWLPLGVVFVAIVYAFGAMGALSIPMTIATMSVLPILIGLGVDYAIQFHNRYDEEARRGETTADAIIDSITHIGPAIGIAIVTACLGFVALFFSPVPMIQDFGYTLILGVIACYILAISFLLAILYQRDRRAKPTTTSKRLNNKPTTERKGFVESGLHRIAPRVINNPAIIISVAVMLTVIGVIADFYIETNTDEKQFVSSDLQVIQDLDTLEELAGGFTSVNLLVEAEDVTTPEILTWMVQLKQRISVDQSAMIKNINSVADLVLQANGGEIPQNAQQAKEILSMQPAQVKRNLITDDGTASNIIIVVGEMGGEQIKELKTELVDYTTDHPDGVSIAVTGLPVVLAEVVESLTGGRLKMTLISLAFVFVSVFLLFRLKVIRALMAILPIVLIIGWSSGVMYLSGIKYTPLTATLGALIIGIGVEFTILLMMRYYEERGKGETPQEAMTTAMTKIGRAIIVSGFTVIGGFGALLIARDFPVLGDFGVVTMVNVFFALVSTLIVLPPLIVWVDSWREKRRLPRLD